MLPYSFLALPGSCGRFANRENTVNFFSSK